MRNLIFVGLPGSGKSTVGRLAARTLGLPFVDADKANFLAYDRVRRVYRLLGGVVGQAYHDGQAKM